jgi:hypothetical protein
VVTEELKPSGAVAGTVKETEPGVWSTVTCDWSPPPAHQPRRSPRTGLAGGGGGGGGSTVVVGAVVVVVVGVVVGGGLGGGAARGAGAVVCCVVGAGV